MVSPTPRHLAARKRPVQARSAVTLDAIFQASIQVLVAEGLNRLTTTRVAERAGVSVGTMYQYFPHKQALLYALNERYLENLAGRMEATCLSQHGAPMADMIVAVVNAYWDAKTERPDVTSALYRSAVELDNQSLLETFGRRMDAATLAMIVSAPDATYADPALVNSTLLSVIFGTVRNVFERNLPPMEAEALRDQLIAMCMAYLRTAEKR